jgi:hypothetical protein
MSNKYGRVSTDTNVYYGYKIHSVVEFPVFY